jgi:hypothetical protein
MDTQTVLLFHVAVSFIALPLGFVALKAYFAPTPPVWTRWFLAFAIATILSGFLLPIPSLTPATLLGIIATLVIIAMTVANYAFKQNGIWKKFYAIGMVASSYFLAFVLIAQAFLKLPPLKTIAPTGTELPFVIAQLILLAGFIWIGIQVYRKAGSAPAN